MPHKEEPKKALRRAIRYLVYRDRSRNEMVRYLERKRFSANTVDETLAFLENNGYINDPRFALQFGKSRIENKKVGKLRLERELKNKGLENQIIDETLRSLYEEYDELEVAMACAQKKLESSVSNDIEKERRRLAKFLERRGFSTSLVYQVVTQLVPYVPSKDFTPPFPSTGKQRQETESSRKQD